MPVKYTRMRSSAKCVVGILFVLSSQIIRAEDARTPQSGENLLSLVDPCTYSLIRGPLVREGHSGVLHKGGYCDKQARLIKRSYRCTSDESRDLIVDVVSHPADYRFVMHDFYGTFLHAQRSLAESESTDEGGGILSPIQFVRWPVDDGDKTVAIFMSPRGADRYYFLAGWHSTSEAGSRTVMVRSADVQGVPQDIVSYWLDEIPSALVASEEDFSYESWKNEDLQKWADLIAESPRDERIIGAARINLLRHEKDDFGLGELSLLSQEEDSDAYTLKATDAINRIRDKANVPPLNPKSDGR